MQSSTATSSRMNFSTNLWLHFMLLCCPLHRLSWLHSASTLGILGAAGGVSMVVGVPTNPATIGDVSDLIITALKALGRALGSAIGGRIHAANYAKILATQPLIVLNSSSEIMANPLPIWCSAIPLNLVLLSGFRTPAQISTSHPILPL